MRQVVTSLEQAWWWRFDAYELRGGYLRPAPGAKLTRYDPWARRRARSPLESLMALSNSVPFAAATAWVGNPLGGSHRSLHGDAGLPDEERDDHDEATQLVLAWCAEHGLLGILLARVISVVLAPVDEGPSWLPPLYQECFPGSLVYVRGVGGWGFTVSQLSNDAGREDARGRVLFDPQHTWHQGPSDAIRVEPIGETWARYFPDVPRRERSSFQYPKPMTDDFWRLYAEPLHEFVHAAQDLQRAVEAIRSPRPGRVPPETVRARGEHLLQNIGAHARIALGKAGGQYYEQPLASSLLGVLAIQAVREESARPSSRICARENCGEVFEPKRPGQRYHVTRCQRTAAQARLRAKKRRRRRRLGLR